MALTDFKIEYDNGTKIYVRGARKNSVWSAAACYAKLEEKMKLGGREAVAKLFSELSVTLGQYGKEPVMDPMMFEWFKDCYERMSACWDVMQPPPTTTITVALAVPPPVIPSSATTIEEFGSDLEEFGS